MKPWLQTAKRKRGWGGYSQEIALNSLWKGLSYREAEKQVQVCRATFVLCQQIHFSLQEKTHSAITTFSTILPLSISTFRRGFLRARHTEPSRALLYCAWHILEGSHCGMWRYSHSIPVKGKLSGLSPTQQSPGGQRRGDEVELRAN